MDAHVKPLLFLEAPASSPCAEPDLGRSRSTLGVKSATVSTSLGDSLSEPHHSPSDSDDDILALNSFSLSLVSDNSGDDDGDFNLSGLSLDTLLSFSPPCSSTTLQSSPRTISGLGISGLTRKDGSGPFDGLGVVSIKSSAWRHDDHSSARKLGEGIELSESIQGFRQRPSSFSCSSTCDASSESEDFDPSLLITQSDRLSDVFLRETFLTFTEDPFHAICHSNIVNSSSILDGGDNNDSWSELGLGDESISTSTSISEFKSLLANTAITSTQSHDSRPGMPSCRHRRIPKLNINFSSPTISSKLKRSSTIIGIPKNTWRYRSSSLPTGTTEDSATIPLSRCKWRL